MTTQIETIEVDSLPLNELSEALLLAVKMGDPTKEIRVQLEDISRARLFSDLKTDNQKKAFWINCYNAFYQILRKEDKLSKPNIYRKKCILICSWNFSLDDIEHGILRKNKFKWSLGYLTDPFASGILKKLAVHKIDYRIHFALNCGAKSCPPIAFYRPDKLDVQLDIATQSFLESETEVLPDRNVIRISRLFQWFKGDFGGLKGTRSIHQQYLNSDLTGMKIIYKPYDWDEELDNFVV